MHTEADDSAYVFIPRERLEIIKAAKVAGVWTGKRPAVSNLRRDWLEIVRAAEIPHATLHDLRRAAVTNWARCLPANVVQDLAGHANYETTKKFYAVTTKADMVEARRATEKALSGLKTGTSDPEVTPMGCYDPSSGV